MSHHAVSMSSVSFLTRLPSLVSTGAVPKLPGSCVINHQWDLTVENVDHIKRRK